MTSALLLSAALVGCIEAEEVETSTIESALSVYQWSNDVQTGGRSGYQPGLAQFGTRLYMIATNMDIVSGNPSKQLFTQRFNGSSWSTPAYLGQYADYGPALTVFNNQLTTIYHRAYQNRLVMSTSSDGVTWSTPVTAGTTLNAATVKYAPAIAVRDGALYAAYCVRENDGSDHIRIDRFVTSWSTVKQFNVSSPCKHIALGLEPDGRFRMLFTIEHGPQVWGFLETRDTGGSATVWSTPTSVPNMQTVKPPSLTTCNGVTHMLHGGYSSPSEIWWSARENNAWIYNQKVPGQVSDGGAALGCFNNNRTIMAHNGGYDDVWWSEFLP